MEFDGVAGIEVGSEAGFKFGRRNLGEAGELGAGDALTSAGEESAEEGGFLSMRRVHGRLIMPRRAKVGNGIQMGWSREGSPGEIRRTECDGYPCNGGGTIEGGVRQEFVLKRLLFDTKSPYSLSRFKGAYGHFYGCSLQCLAQCQ